MGGSGWVLTGSVERGEEVSARLDNSEKSLVLSLLQVLQIVHELLPLGRVFSEKLLDVGLSLSDVLELLEASDDAEGVREAPEPHRVCVELLLVFLQDVDFGKNQQVIEDPVPEETGSAEDSYQRVRKVLFRSHSYPESGRFHRLP